MTPERPLALMFFSLAFPLACHHADVTLEGTVGGHAFAPIAFGYFDVAEDSLYHLFFADYDFSCREWKEFGMNGVALESVPSSVTVGAMMLYPFRWEGGHPAPAGDETGTYEALDYASYLVTDTTPELTEGGLYVWGQVSFSSSSGSINDSYTVTAGSLELSSVTLESWVVGSFSLELDDGSVLDGTLALPLCDLP